MSHAYPSSAIGVAHPARMRALAAAHCVGSWSGERFRYLELGCGNAANLLPLAAQFPEATFVGVDRAAGLVDDARQAAELCGLRNVRLVAADLRDFELDAEPYDFVVSHGVYSWVPPAVQARLLELVHNALAPLGAALVSYNTLPGWAVRGLVRDAMREAALLAEGGEEGRLRAARARLATLRRHLGKTEHPYATLLASEIELAQQKVDGYLLGEYLAETNEALYLGQFAARAEAARLRYVGELMNATAEGAMERDVPHELALGGHRRVEAEQLLDLMTYRQFRATLLCRDDVVVADEPNLALLADGAFAAALAPEGEDAELAPGKSLRLLARGGAGIEAHQPLLKAALLVLAERWPEGFRARELVAAALETLRVRGLEEVAAVDDAEIDRTLSDLGELCRRRLVELLPWTPALHRVLDPAPLVHPFTRLEAARHGVVTVPAHEPLALEEPLRTVCSLLDGRRDLRALCREVGARVDSGELRVAAGPLQAPSALPAREHAEALHELVLRSVARLRDFGLLRPPLAT